MVGVKLVPFIVTTFGTLGPEARRLVNWLGKLLEGTFGKVDLLFI